MRWASRRRITAALLLVHHAPRANAYVHLSRAAATTCTARHASSIRHDSKSSASATAAPVAASTADSAAETAKAIPTANTDLLEGRKRRYRATVMYDGQGFKGFQVQPEPQRTVQVSTSLS
jgi:3-deoxy-D-arabino-heptulosonate 7-phosphate (DAHP) synthase